MNPRKNVIENVFETCFENKVFMYCVLESDFARESGVPTFVLEKPQFVLHLDPAYHAHNELEFTDEGVALSLSFDAVYRCALPWKAFLQVGVLLPPPAGVKRVTPKQKPTLRLVE